MSLEFVPEMVNIVPNEGNGFECEAGVSTYVNISPGGDPVDVNVCCTRIVDNPGVEASAKESNKLIRETSSSVIDSARHPTRLL